MRFDCGPTEHERFLLERKTAQDKASRLSEWHDYFVWWPMQIKSHECVWLETIERRAKYRTKQYYPITHWHTWERPDFWEWEFRNKA